jgi:DNA-binding transcriptional ArsR family regulator
MELFKILSKTKVELLERLLKDEECCSNLSRCLGKDISTVSRHLHQLERAGLIGLHREGRNVSCTVRNPEKLRLLLALGKELEKGV